MSETTAWHIETDDVGVKTLTNGVMEIQGVYEGMDALNALEQRLRAAEAERDDIGRLQSESLEDSVKYQLENSTLRRQLAGAEQYGRSCDAVMQAQQADLNRLHEILADHKAQLAASESARRELEARLECKAPVIQYDPACDHESDPIEKALYIVANNVAKHTMTGKHWDCQDTCWLEALEEARAIIRGVIESARQAAEGRAQLADEAKWFVEQGLLQAKADNAILHIPMYEDWLARYQALSSPVPAARDGEAEA